MTEDDVREIFEDFKRQNKNPTMVHCEFDADGNVSHAEVKNDTQVLWVYPKGSRPKFSDPSYMSYGRNGKNFSVARDRSHYEALSHSNIV